LFITILSKLEASMAKLVGNVNLKATRELVVTVSEEEFNEHIEKVAREYQKKVKLQGFRPGKAPLELVRNAFEREIIEDAQEEAIKHKIYDEIKARKEDVVSEIYIKDRKNGQDGITVSVEYEALPSFIFPNLSHIKLERKIKRISEIDVENEIESYRRQLGKLQVLDRESEEGDFLIVDYEEIENGKTVRKKQNLTIQVSNENINGAIIDKFLHKKRGDTVEIDYMDEENKKVKVVYNVKDVAELFLPEVDDEFAKKLGYENMEKMREEIREYLIKESEKASEDELEWHLIDEIYNRVQFELPRSLVEDRITIIAQSFKYDPKDPEVRKSLEKIAKDIVKKEIILKNYIDQENLETTEEEISSLIEEKAKNYRMDPKAYRAELEKRGLIDEIKDEILRNKALVLLKNSVKVEVIIE